MNISVDLRLSTSADGKVKAHADITIPLGDDGLLRILGFSVIERDSESPWVAPPARKGQFRYFDIVSLIGKIKASVDEAVITEYRRQKAVRP